MGTTQSAKHKREGVKKTEQREKGTEKVYTDILNLAEQAAIDAGIIPTDREEDTYDFMGFWRFWQIFERNLLKKGPQYIQDSVEMLYQEGYRTPYYRAKQRIEKLETAVCSLAGLLAGCLFMQILLNLL